MDDYSKIPKMYGMENITIEEAMDELDMIQARFIILDEFSWLDMERIQTDPGAHFTSKDFQEGLSLRGVLLALAAQYHKEINGQVEFTLRAL